MSPSDLHGKYFRVLDHGHVGLVDSMGDDSAIVQAARVSYGKGTIATSSDRTLIRYLMNHRHTTPFEMVVFKFNIAMPIHAARQHVRHRASTLNEYSARYSIVPDVIYNDYEIKQQSASNKQGRSDELVSGTDSLKERVLANEVEAFKLYGELVEAGAAKELARMHLPLNTYTYFYWKVDLHNLLHYLGLRCDSHAQYEIRAFANCMAAMVKEVCPLAFEAWYDYSFAGARMSKQDRQLLSWYVRFAANATVLDLDTDDYLTNEVEKQAHGLGMTKRELADWWKKIEPATEQEFDLGQFEEFVPNVAES